VHAWSAALANRGAIPDKMRMRLGAIILAGGRSRRMGRAKELLPIGGTTMLGRLCAELTAVAAPVVVVARDAGQALPPLPAAVQVTCDTTPDQGPLAGLATGLGWLGEHGFAGADPVFAASCDLPLLTAAFVSWLREQLGDHALVMPRVGGHLQPLAAIYRMAVLPFAETLLLGGAKSPRSLSALRGARVVDEREFPGGVVEQVRSVDTPAEYEATLFARERRTSS
jgi:molybdopterin-guanine dinucleotide biosynthesis protein A